MQNGEMFKWSSTGIVELKWWEINDAILLKNKGITGLVTKSHKVSLPFPLFIVSLPPKIGCQLLAIEMQLFINT